MLLVSPQSLLTIGFGLVLALFPVPTSAQSKTGLDAQAWAGVRAAHESKLHEARADGEGFFSYNPGQEWNNQFDGRGLTVAPAGADWT